MSEPTVDIIIKSWDAVDYTLAAIRSIREKTKTEYRITIVDDGSNPDTISVLEQQKDITLIRHLQNIGPGAVAKTGFDATSSKYFVLMDNDIVVTDGWLDELLSEIDDSIGAVAPLRYGSKLKYPYSSISSREVWQNIKTAKGGSSLHEQLDLYFNNHSIEQFEKDFINANQPKTEIVLCPPGFVSTSLILLNRNAVENSGGISASEFTTYGGEDVDLCWRLGDNGYKVIRSSNVYVHHFEHSSMEENNQSVKENLAQGNVLLYKKWGSKLDNWKKMLENSDSKNTIDDYPFIKLFSDIKNGRTDESF